MSASAPWSVKGIDAKAREVAKDLARRSGMTLGEWLNQMILEGEDVGAMIAREREKSQRQAPQPAPRAVYRDVHPAYDDDDDRRPLYREPRRPAPAFSTASQPLARDLPRDLPRRDPRRSIFEGQPRFDDYEDETYASASGDLARVARALENLGARIESSEGRSANAVRGVSSAVENLMGRIELSETTAAETQARLDAQVEEFNQSAERLVRAEDDRNALDTRISQAERLIDAQAERLEGLSGHFREERERIAGLEEQLNNPQSIETIRAVEGALGRLANQLYENEARARDTVKDVREDMVGLSHRLTQIELRDPERVAQGVIDKVVARLAQRLDSAEAQTNGAIKALEQAFTTIDKRLTAAESQGDISDPETARSFRQLAAELSQRVEDSRAELKAALAEGLASSADSALSQFTSRIEAAEQSSAAAIEKLGQDIGRLAGNMNRRVASVEATGQNKIKALTETVEAQMGRSESAHAQAMERLSSEMARISERLGNKLADTERRTLEMLGGVGEQIEQQRDQIRQDLNGRIRQSEERTVKALAETAGRFDQKLAHVQTQSLLTESLARAPVASPRDEDELPNPFSVREHVPHFTPAPRSTPEVSYTPEPAAAFFAPPVIEDAPDVAPYTAPVVEHESDVDLIAETEVEPDILAAPEVAPEAPVAARPRAPASDFKPAFDPFEGEDDGYDAELLLEADAPQALFVGATPEEEDDSDPFAELDTSRKIEPQRDVRPAGAFGARPPRPPVMAGPRFELDDELAPEADEDAVRDEGIFAEPATPSAVAVSTRDALAAARAAVRAAVLEDGEDDPLPSLKSGASRSRGEAKTPAKPQAKPQGNSTLMSALKASGIAVLATTAVVGGGLMAYKTLNSNVAQPAKSPAPIAAAAIDVTKPDPASDNNPSLQANLKTQFDLASQALDAKQAGAVEKMKVVANQGYAPAEFRLGGLYGGEGGLITPDKAQARLWTQRAAEGGIAKAMHNLALMYYGGDGGPQDRVMAAMWYRKAAERGIEDSQYNLGILYQEGDGVAMNLSESYKWLSLAAKSGDAEAAKAATAVKAQLSDQQVQKVDDQVAGFVPISDGQPPMASADSQSNG